MLAGCRRSRQVSAVLAGGAVAGAFLLAGAGASATPAPGRSADAARAEGSALASREQAALLDLYALESTLARARANAEMLRGQSLAAARRETSARRGATLVRRSLDLTATRVSALVWRLYVQGGVSPLAIFLGATSLDEAIEGIDALRRSAEHNERLVGQLRDRLSRLRREEEALRARRSELEAARRNAEAGALGLARQVQSRGVYVAALRRQGAIATARVAELEEQARVAQRATPRSVPATTTARVASTAETTAALPVQGTRTLTVAAVAYHLPGRTASGLPVGPGVVAVDPTVIPLGTRLFVPGYGQAVAADVGLAIKGNLIDLWFPTTRQALAWGRRTITITVYG